MIYCLNNMKGFSHRYNVDEQRTCMDHNTYVAQNGGFVGKVVHLKFKDEAQQLVRTRLNINKNNFPDFTGVNTNNLASDIQQRTTRVTWVDCCICLNKFTC